jgi:hypothetical protein
MPLAAERKHLGPQVFVFCDMNVCRGCTEDDECAGINPGSTCSGGGACGEWEAHA